MKTQHNGVGSRKRGHAATAGGRAACPVEPTGIQARCYAKSVYETICRLDKSKRKLVASIGFSGLLQFPLITSTNKKLSAWIINRVNIATSSIVLPDGARLPFCSKDIAMVFGIPSAGKNVVEAGHMDRDSKEKIKMRCWPLSGKEQRSIKAVEELLNHKYAEVMTPAEQDNFKVAFVVYVMSSLFVPAAKHDYVCDDYWGAVSDPSSIHLYDWAEYIYGRLLAAIGKFQTDAMSGCPNPFLTGCCLFLQVFYLDNMDLGDWNVGKGVSPRISCFSAERMSSMIASLTPHLGGPIVKNDFTHSKVRMRDDSCYNWRRKGKEVVTCPVNCTLMNLWEAAVNMAAVLHLPFECAGPLFVAVWEYEREQQAGMALHGIECMNVMLNIMRPYARGYNTFGMEEATTGSLQTESTTRADERHATVLDNSTEINKGQCLCSSHSSINKILGDVGRITVHEENNLDINECVMRAMAQFYLLVGRLKRHNTLDLNTPCVEYDTWHKAPVRNDVVMTCHAKTPWELGWVWDCTEETMIPDVIRERPSGEQRPFALDYCPKYIEVMGGAAWDQVNGISEFEMDSFDAILRSFVLSDDILYGEEGRLCWRHFFESDITASILAGCFDIDNPCTRNQFVGAHLKYDIYHCSILFFPFILHDRWVCLAWKLKDNTIVIFDPACRDIPGFCRTSSYDVVVRRLKSVMKSTSEALFPGWHHEWDAAEIKAFNWMYSGVHW